MHIAKFAAEPVEMELGGVQYRVSKLRVRDIAYIERWLAEVVADAEGAPVTSANRPTMASKVGLLLLNTGEGTARIVHASLRQTIPGFTIRDARDLVNSLDKAEADSIVIAAFPEPDEESESKDQDRDPNGMNWHAGVLLLANKYQWTDEYILNMPLDRFFGMCQDIEDVRPKYRKKWAVPMKTPADFDREWARRMANQSVQAMDN